MNLIADNAKTGMSIFDMLPGVSCDPACPIMSKCYDIRLLKFRPAVKAARTARHQFLLAEPDVYVDNLTKEIMRKRKRPETVRLFGGGDFMPEMEGAIDRILAQFPDIVFYAISKSIRAHIGAANRLTKYRNFRLILSEGEGFHFGWAWNKLLRNSSRVKRAYTLMPHEEVTETEPKRAHTADIVFNVDRKRASIQHYLKCGLSLCPCDAGLIPHKGACSVCGYCAAELE